MPLFKKKTKDMTEIGKGSSAAKKTGVTIEEQIEELSGDVGRMDYEKKIISGRTPDDDAIGKSKRKKSTNTSLVKSKKEAIKAISIPKTVQQSIPYKRVYANGIIESETGLFTKSYKLTDANFRTATQDAQEEMYFAYGDLLNYFTPDVRPQIVVYNRAVDREQFKKNTLFEERDDEYNSLRKDINKIMLDKISEGQNSFTQEKYLVVSVKAENIEVAAGTFSRIDGEVSSRIKAINEHATDPMDLKERLELLYNIYNQDTDIPFFRKMNIDGNEARSFDLGWMHQLGLTTKDMIGPNGMKFEDNYFKLGDKFGRSLFLRNLPTQLSAEVLTDIANVPCSALISTHFAPIRQDEAVRLVRDQMLEVTRNMTESAKRQAKNGLVSSEFLPPDLVQSKRDSDKFYEDLTVRDQKAFLMTVVVTVFADDMEDLDKYTKMVQNNADKHLCSLARLTAQQERGLASSLPLGTNRVWADRLMNSESAALFIPFESQEMVQPHGLYYGVNATSRNLIIINRLRGQNSNGMILGMSGSGKSFTAKMEMTQVFLTDQKNEIFVIDPQAEYRPLCESLGGQVIRIAPGSDTHINPFDMDINNDGKDTDDPVTVKSNYICSICESAIGGHYGLNPVQVSVIDRCVRILYEPYLEYMDEQQRQGNNITCDKDKCPTFRDFYNLLAKQPEPEAEYIRLAIEKYCVGSYNTFAFKTNVKTNNRFIVYDIRDIGTGMREMGMQVCLNDIWNRTIANKSRGVRTWVYIDELYVLTQSENCARFLMYIFKQIRKYGGAPTGITQNVEDLLSNRESRGILNNCDFILMLNQSSEDRQEIGAMLHISEAQLNYIKNAESGRGLIYTGRGIVPFINRVPQDLGIYKTISSNPNEQIPVV